MSKKYNVMKSLQSFFNRALGRKKKTKLPFERSGITSSELKKMGKHLDKSRELQTIHHRND